LGDVLRQEVLPRLVGRGGVERVYGGPEVKWGRAGRWLTRPCPLHGGDGRNFHVDPDTLGWRCHSGCQESGDAVSYVERTQGLDFPGAVRFLADLAGVTLPDAPGGSVGTRRRPPPRPPPARQERPREALRRAPLAELEALWGACLSVTTATGPARAFLAGRGWESQLEELDTLDVVRLLPESYPWPSWWPGSWARSWRLVAPAYEADGTLASLHARAVLPDADPKTRWPYGPESKELLLADPNGYAVLRGVPVVGLRAVLVVEGLTGTLNMALRMSTLAAQLGPVAVLGATSGGFEALARVAWPVGAEAWVGTDTGDTHGTGDKYAAKVNETLAPRGVVVRRVDFGAVGEE
jgi:hypothetical protein